MMATWLGDHFILSGERYLFDGNIQIFISVSLILTSSKIYNSLEFLGIKSCT